MIRTQIIIDIQGPEKLGKTTNNKKISQNRIALNLGFGVH